MRGEALVIEGKRCFPVIEAKVVCVGRMLSYGDDDYTKPILGYVVF
jgi:hypothetical protein